MAAFTSRRCSDIRRTSWMAPIGPTPPFCHRCPRSDACSSWGSPGTRRKPSPQPVTSSSNIPYEATETSWPAPRSAVPSPVSGATSPRDPTAAIRILTLGCLSLVTLFACPSPAVPRGMLAGRVRFAWLDDAGLVGKDHRLDPVAQAELGEQVAHV